jgi:hypothetical protein
MRSVLRPEMRRWRPIPSRIAAAHNSLQPLFDFSADHTRCLISEHVFDRRKVGNTNGQECRRFWNALVGRNAYVNRGSQAVEVTAIETGDETIATAAPIPVTSSQIAAVEYDPIACQLVIRFRGSGRARRRSIPIPPFRRR